MRRFSARGSRAESRRETCADLSAHLAARRLLDVRADRLSAIAIERGAERWAAERRAGAFDRQAAFAAMGADHAMDPEGSRHPGMHKTATVDYAIVLSGEIYALMDEGETLLQAGDCLVQRGTNHAWGNRSDAPCLVAFILVSAKPV